MAAILRRNRQQGLFETPRGRVLLENLTGYLLIAPAGIIIFLFGLFPVAFALFVSLHRWRRFPGDFLGLDQYVEALGNLAFVLFFWLAAGAMVYGLWRLFRHIKTAEDKRPAVLYFVPGVAVAAVLFSFIRWFFLLLPVVLDVPQRLRGQRITRDLFLDEFFASFAMPEVAAAAGTLLQAAVLAAALTLLFLRFIPAKNRTPLLLETIAIPTTLFGGGVLMRLTLAEIRAAIDAAREAGAALPVWSQTLLISGGAGLLFAAYFVWQRTVKDERDGRFVMQSLAVVLALIGAYLLIVQLPNALADADDDVLRGFSVTAMYSAFSVPLQLTLGLGLAVLLFQNIKGKSLFRVVYFLPYVTPFVATSVMFALLFSHRSGSPINRLLAVTGVEPQTWLLEPRGIFTLIFGGGVPDFLSGPGLALAVIILYNVWVYTGYSTVIFLAGLGNIPGELYEAARIDGANSWQSFRHITLPLLSPTTFFLMLIATIGTFQAFTQVFLLRRPGAYTAVDTMNIYIFREVRDANPDAAYGAAMAFALFGVILILTLVQNRALGRKVFYG